MLSAVNAFVVDSELFNASCTQHIVFSPTLDFLELDESLCAENVRRVLRAGNCAELHDGAIVQVLIPVVHATGRAPLSAGECQAVVSTFVAVDTSRPLHPEINLRWLKRSLVSNSLKMVPSSSIRKRVHVVPLYRGGANDSPCEEFASSFLINDFVLPLRVRKANEPIFVVCPDRSCKHKTKCPVDKSVCLLCEACGRIL